MSHCYTPDCAIAHVFKELGVAACSMRLSTKASAHQHAAVDAYIASTRLPLIRATAPRAPQGIQGGCTSQNITLIPSVIALAGTYSNFHNIIIFTPVHELTEVNVSCVHSLRNEHSTGLTLFVSPISDDNSMFRLRFHCSTSSIELVEPRMLAVLRELASHDRTLIMYTCPRSEGYAYAIPMTKISLWVTVDTTDHSVIGESGTALTPVFYTSSTKPLALRLNTGTAVMCARDDAEKTKQQLWSVLASVTGGRTRRDLCYFCGYLDTVHKFYCDDSTAAHVDIQLTDRFAAMLETE